MSFYVQQMLATQNKTLKEIIRKQNCEVGQLLPSHLELLSPHPRPHLPVSPSPCPSLLPALPVPLP